MNAIKRLWATLALYRNWQTCSQCGRAYLLGYNGMGDGCDVCTDTARDPHGYTWRPGETEHVYQDDAGNSQTVTRAKALGV